MKIVIRYELFQFSTDIIKPLKIKDLKYNIKTLITKLKNLEINILDVKSRTILNDEIFSSNISK